MSSQLLPLASAATEDLRDAARRHVQLPGTSVSGGHGHATPRRAGEHRGHARRSLNKRVEQTVGVSSISDLLVAKSPGMSRPPWQQHGLTAGHFAYADSTRCRSAFAPIFIIDGVRMSSSAIGSGIDERCDDRMPNLADLDPHEIGDHRGS